MEVSEPIQRENLQLLVKIFKVKNYLDQIYDKSGPNSSDYISLSIKLDLLTKEYMEEKLRMVRDHAQLTTK